MIAEGLEQSKPSDELPQAKKPTETQSSSRSSFLSSEVQRFLMQKNRVFF